MRNSEIWLKCIEVAMKPIKGRSFNVEMLEQLSLELYPETTSKEERINKLLHLLDQSTNEINMKPLNAPNVPLSELNFTIEKSLSLENVIKRADQLYELAIGKDKP